MKIKAMCYEIIFHPLIKKLLLRFFFLYFQYLNFLLTLAYQVSLYFYPFTYLSISSLLVFLSLSLSFSLTVLTLILPILLDLTLSYTFFPALSTFYLYPTANLTSVKVAFYSFSTFFHSSTSFSIFFSSRLRFFTYSINLD